MRAHRAALAALAVLCGAPAAQAADMTFRWMTYGSPETCGAACPRVIEAQGTITRSTPQAFDAFVARSGGVPGARRVILIHSPGGVLRSGMELGLRFRRYGMSVFVGRFADLETLARAGLVDPGAAARLARTGRGADRPVSGACFSACVYAFLGGRERIVPAASRVGVHRPFRPADPAGDGMFRDPAQARPFDRRDIEDVQRFYVRTMGADPALIALERGVSSDSIRVLTDAELRRLRIITGRGLAAPRRAGRRA
jgi:hypothetical protein